MLAVVDMIKMKTRCILIWAERGRKKVERKKN